MLMVIPRHFLVSQKEWPHQELVTVSFRARARAKAGANTADKWITTTVRTGLFQNDSMPVELLGCVGSALYLGWDDEPKGGQLPDLPQQGHQFVAVVDVKLPVTMAQLHQPPGRLQTA